MENGFARLNPGPHVFTLVKTTLITSVIGVLVGIGLSIWWGANSGSDQVSFTIFAVLFCAVLGAVTGGIGGFAALLGARTAKFAESARVMVSVCFASASLIFLVLISFTSFSIPILVGLVLADALLFALGFLYVAPRLLAHGKR